jgi:hypothetical protein
MRDRDDIVGMFVNSFFLKQKIADKIHKNIFFKLCSINTKIESPVNKP